MRHARTRLELDAFVAAFEAAAADGRTPDPAAFLPPPDHPLYAAVLRELSGWTWNSPGPAGGRGGSKTTATGFPELFRDPAAVRDLVREEYRLRKAAGEGPTPTSTATGSGSDLGERRCPSSQSTYDLDEPGRPGRPDRVPAVGRHDPPGFT